MQAQDLRGVTMCTQEGGLAAGTTTTYTTGTIVRGAVGGKFVAELAAQTNTATPTTDGNGDAFTAVAASQGSVFVFTLVAAGTIAVFQGSVEDLDDADEFKIAPQFPSIDTDVYMPFAYVVVINDSTGSDWTFGASNWTATGVADTYTDVVTMPVRPVEA